MSRFNLEFDEHFIQEFERHLFHDILDFIKKKKDKDVNEAIDEFIDSYNAQRNYNGEYPFSESVLEDVKNLFLTYVFNSHNLQYNNFSLLRDLPQKIQERLISHFLDYFVDVCKELDLKFEDIEIDQSLYMKIKNK